MKNWKRKDSGKSFEETENEIFKDFVGARTESSAYIVKENDDAYKLLLRFLKKPIRIVGDYDVDGQTATAEMILGLRALGATDIDFYAPKRFTDGYGLSTTIVDRFLTGEPGLLVTVDNGIAACDAIKKAKQLGWSVLVIDHHLPVIERGKIILPEADVIIDPHAKAGTANFEDYCAAGLVFKLFQHILTAYNAINTFTFDKIQSLAAIGTVADSVKLIEKIGGNYVYDNWLIVKRGLETLLQNQGRTNGLYCLLRILNLEYKINETNIGYTLAPVMNSVSRLNDDGAKEVIKLLLREDN
ncbi:MAG: DHH family phosphoesterase, partial [Lachnospiraceae bacterium]|nr:DHH family phosphoesterase [Lachnospiraceae bacterium]